LLDLAAKKLQDSYAGLESLVAQRTAALRLLSQRLMKTQDEERRRVARDLHDSTGQTLTALKIQVASLQEQFENGQPAFNALNEIAVTADQALQEIRTTSYLLHPPPSGRGRTRLCCPLVRGRVFETVGDSGKARSTVWFRASA
jgi:signal transduction histidine kinase